MWRALAESRAWRPVRSASQEAGGRELRIASSDAGPRSYPGALCFTVKWPRSLAPQAPALSPQRLQSPGPVSGLGARHAQSSEFEGLTVLPACNSRAAKPTEGLAERTGSGPVPEWAESFRAHVPAQAGLLQACWAPAALHCLHILLHHLFVKGGPTSRGRAPNAGLKVAGGCEAKDHHGRLCRLHTTTSGLYPRPGCDLRPRGLCSGSLRQHHFHPGHHVSWVEHMCPSNSTG